MRGSAARSLSTTQLGQWTQSKATADCVNFALGQPTPSLLPLQAFQEAATAKWAEGADPLMLQYGHPAGHQGFRDELAGFLNRHSSSGQSVVLPEHLVVTGGNSSATNILSTLLRQLRSDRVARCVVESPTYFLVDTILRDASVDSIEIPVDQDGLVVEQLEAAIADGLKLLFVYLIPTFHNPTGVCLSPERAQALVRLAQEHDFWLLSDEPYTLLHWCEEQPPGLAVFDDPEDSRVITMGSFSKILSPGMRLGWMHSQNPLILERAIGGGVINSGGSPNPLGSQLAEQLLASGMMDSHLSGLCETMQHRCRALCAALREHLPSADFDEPSGGYFVWVRLPAGLTGTQLASVAAEHGVQFCPGSRCSVGSGAAELDCFIRLSFAFYPDEELEEGVRRLASAVKELQRC